MVTIPEDGQLITKEGFVKLKSELGYLKNTRRHEISERIERAKELGDLSENAEYSEAKDEQAFNEGKIIEIQGIIKKLTVVEHRSGETVGLGSKVTVECNGREKEFTIVSFNEVDPENNKISNESPIGNALLGKKVNEEAIVNLPSGKVAYKVLKVD